MLACAGDVGGDGEDVEEPLNPEGLSGGVEGEEVWVLGRVEVSEVN